jgi:purine-binding chemotaxis protein CheW
MEQQVVVFDLAGESFGIDIAGVESIIKMQPITQLPQSRHYILGVINLRGAVLPVVDLRIHFGLSIKETTRQTRIMIATMGKLKVGLVVDAVSEVLRIPDDSLEALPATVSAINTGFLKSIARLENRLITLLELGKILDAEDQQLLSGNPG